MNKNITIGIAVVAVLGAAGLFFMGGERGQMAVSNVDNTGKEVAPPAQMPIQMDMPTPEETATAIAPTPLSPAQPTPSVQPVSAAKETPVTYTDNGFVPKSVTIKNGETVTWTNTTSHPMWVASDPHPTHTNYPGFDAKTRIAKGETYSFTFIKVGSWGYHNHLSAADTGTVIVK